MDVAASEFYDNKDKTYDLNFKEEVTCYLYKFRYIWEKKFILVVCCSSFVHLKLVGKLTQPDFIQQDLLLKAWAFPNEML